MPMPAGHRNTHLMYFYRHIEVEDFFLAIADDDDAILMTLKLPLATCHDDADTHRIIAGCFHAR